MWLLFKLRPSGVVQKPLQYINILYWYMSRQVDIWKCEIIDLWGSSSSPGELFQWLKPVILYKVQQQFENNTYEFKVYNTHRSQTVVAPRRASDTSCGPSFSLTRFLFSCHKNVRSAGVHYWKTVRQCNGIDKIKRPELLVFVIMVCSSQMELIFWISSKCGVYFFSYVGLV